jgi:endonuclease/exonuclease/phosphatase (EEP) superfamily protein YafD
VFVLPESYQVESGAGMFDALAERGYRVEMMPMKEWRRRPPSPGQRWRPPAGVWCLSIATRLPVLERRELSMGKAFRDPVGRRAALQLDLAVGEQRIHVVGLHTSSKLYYGAPLTHLARLRSQLPRGPEPALVAGDFNFWGPGVVATLRDGWRRTVRGPTWPAHRPHSQIDHILVNDAVKCLEAEVLPASGSDHRAVRARLAI